MKKRNGYTLFELLVSISIIAILTALATISYSAAQKKARDSRRVQDMDSIQKAAEVYYSNNSYSYPADKNSFGSVLQIWPSDPKPAPWTQYRYTLTAGVYCACAALDNLTGGNASDSDCTWAANSSYYCVKSQQ